MPRKKLLIFIITYKASFRLSEVYKRIPFKKLTKYNTSLLISDDMSRDDTVFYANNIRKKHTKKIFININKKNLGYGGNIKKCLNFSLKKKFNYAVMIHGDGQYHPKYIPNLLKDLSRKDNISATTGSRLLKGTKKATKGRMPFYKVIGNIILTKIFNTLINTNFSDAHTGLWAYNLIHLKDRKFNSLTSGYNFDNEFRFLNIKKNKIIKEISIQAKYGDERSQLHIKYAIRFFFNTILFFLIKKKIIKSLIYN